MGENLRENEKFQISDFEFGVIKQLEKIINRKIPRVDAISWDDTYEENGEINVFTSYQLGYEVKDGNIIGLGLNFSFKDQKTNKTIHFFEEKLKNFPEIICNLKFLKKLELGNNSIEVLPESIGALNKLKILKIGRNNLKKLPDSFCKLKSLEQINFMYNQLGELPENFGYLKSLKLLNFDPNRIKSLPNSFGELNSLETLFLSNNDLKTLPESFGKLYSLKEFELLE